MTGSAETARTGRPKVVVSVPPHLREEFFTEETWRRLSTAADLTVLDDHTDRAALAAALPGARALVTSWGTPRIDSELLDGGAELELVAHTGSAVAPYVTEDVFRRGVRVTQAGDEMARPVAEVALAFTLALLHRTHRFDHALRTGAPWESAGQAPPRHEIHGSAIGVIGASRTGRAYIALARALGAHVSVADPYLTPSDAERLGVHVVALEDLLRRSRIVAVHAPATAETRRLLDAERLALLPDGAGLVNTARSWLVDETALADEVRSGRIDAAVDVFDSEPLPLDHPFRTLPNMLLTPHTAAGTVECRRRLGASAVTEVLRLLDGLPPLTAVDERSLARLH
ncbi:hydroxyacid dehydrogenase [Streptomyces sp. VRA16 Mangrove soil]|uniref:hydroxyacid dehydrogenase n=1 Tax=Streptomyces sp. VRA16 Mangrove soil TaxID=2817434 RepID=UPI001A9DADBF|nr:hydroxyacid dehydrogenase [Streptomyces sp. VRA16 Mangrove soil]MBO1330060.1 hydroxyacid dehydrogenase [Streptomyces sp. VRA16 Mangrove soil]